MRDNKGQHKTTQIAMSYHLQHHNPVCLHLVGFTSLRQKKLVLFTWKESLRANAVAWCFIPECTSYRQDVPNMDPNTKYDQTTINIVNQDTKNAIA